MSQAIEIHDLGQSGQLQVVYRKPDATLEAPPSEFSNPLEASDQRELDWYFREYAEQPFGAAKARSEAVETGLRNLGRVLFESTFNANPEAAGIYSRASGDGLGETRLEIVSSRREFLRLPWELMNETEAGYPATQMASVIRRGPSEALGEFDADLPTDQLNVLLIAPRPSLENSLFPSLFRGGLASEAAVALEGLEVQAELEYVSPSSFKGLTDALETNPRYYHVVQLDGIAAGDEPGTVILETSVGPETVEIAQLGRTLESAQVPVAFLNGPGEERLGSLGSLAGAASDLAEHGVPVVVCLPYPLADSASRELFVRQFYQSLAGGMDAAASAARARNALMESPVRVILSGKQVMWDWVAPVTFQSREYSPRAIEGEAPDPLAPPMLQPQQQDVNVEMQLPAAGAFGLVGRQGELHRLERIFTESPTVSLTGPTGSGKTELCLGLARWFQRIGRKQRPGGVFYTTFEASHPSGLERIVHEIGTSVAGLEFPDLSLDQQRSWVVEYLQQHPSLIIWDNVENAAGFPSGSPGLLEPEELEGLNEFIASVAGEGQSWVLLATRRDGEDWLSVPHRTMTLPGLQGGDWRELAAAVVSQAGVDPGRLSPEVVDIVDFVEGNPLAMKIVLPRLKDVPATALLAELQRTLESLPESAQEEGRPPSLTAAMEFSWGKMSRRSRAHLPFLALFQRRVMMDILNHMTGEAGYKGAMGEELGWGATRTLLRTGQADGFLEGVSPSVYQIHPALPWFYGRKLGQQVAAARLRDLEQEYVRVYADTADYFMESLYENQDAGVTAILAEEGNLTQALGLALEARHWDNAQLLVQPLAQVYRMQKRFPELRRLRRQLLEVVGVTAEEAASNAAEEFWTYLLGTEASESVDVGDLEYAEDLNRQLYEYLAGLEGSSEDPRVAAVSHQFGQIALRRFRLDEAAGWFEQSLGIIENGEDRASVADDYFALGQVKQHQRYYAEAKELYQKALDIHQRLPDEEEMVKDYRALGAVSHLRFEYQEAESWYLRARAIVEEQRDEETAVLIFHELGTVSHSQYLFDDAIDYYEQALNLADRLGMEVQMAVEFHHLGLLQQNRGIIYDEAEEWYVAALNQWELVGNRRAVGDECRQLGVLFHEQKRYEEAGRWYHQAREVFEELGDLLRAARTYGQLGMVAEEQEDIPGALEWVARTYQLAMDYNLPMVVQVKAHLARLRDKMGLDGFEEWWQDFTGEAAPTDLDVDTSTVF